MTVVVGVRHRQGVVFAADSLVTLSEGGAIRKMRGGKTTSFSETVAIACCGDTRLAQLIEFGVELDDDTSPHLGVDEQRWAVRTFLPLVADVLSQGGYLHRNEADAVEHMGNSAFLLAVRNRLFTVGGDMSVSEDVVPWACEGSGWEIAAGVLARRWRGDADVTRAKAEKNALAAVEAAIEFNAYVDGEVTTEETVRITQDERALLRNLA